MQVAFASPRFTVFCWYWYCCDVLDRLQAKRSGRLKDPTKLSVKSVTLNWLQTICVWKELIERGTLETDSYVSLRMEDFIRKLRHARARLADLMPVYSLLSLRRL